MADITDAKYEYLASFIQVLIDTPIPSLEIVYNEIIRLIDARVETEKNKKIIFLLDKLAEKRSIKITNINGVYRLYNNDDL